MSEPTVAELAVYPVKSARGVPLRRAHLDERGIAYDRHWMAISDARGRFLTQRGKPQLALVEPEVAPDGTLTLRAPGSEPITIDPRDHHERRRADIWATRGLSVVDQGDAVAEWLTAHLGKRSRLVRIADDAVRPVDRRFTQTAQVGLADGFPLLVTSAGSLEDLNERLAAEGEAPVPMNRFRPNIVAAGAAPWAEDTWEAIRIGGVVFDLPKPCARCEIANTDQDTAARSSAVLDALGAFREHPDHDSPLFGWNAIQRGRGTVEVGMAIEVLKYRDAPLAPTAGRSPRAHGPTAPG